LAPKEVAAQLGVCERTACRLMATGQIEGFRIGRLWRTPLEKVHQYRVNALERYRPSLSRVA
jgi:excisionase family DNA binding protein